MMFVNIQGEEVPAIGMGTYELRGARCTEAVEHALAIGYRHVDTAQGYENEEAVGAGLANAGVPRDHIFLTTKIWIGGASPMDVFRKTETSLRHLNAEYIDLLLIHWPTPDMDLPGALEAMMKFREAGRIRHIGVSNFTPELLVESLEHAPIFCNQVEYHPYLAQDELLAFAQERDLMLTAYSPIAKGRVLQDATLVKIGRRYGKSPAQVAIRWLLQHENVASIPKAASPEHRMSNIDIFDFALTDEEMEEVASLARNERMVDPEWAPW